MVLETIKLILFIAVIIVIVLVDEYQGLHAACFVGFCYLIGYFGRERFDDFMDALNEWGKDHSIED